MMNKVFTVAESCYYEQPEIIGTFESIEAAEKVVRGNILKAKKSFTKISI